MTSDTALYVLVLTHKGTLPYSAAGAIEDLVGPFASHDTAVEYCWANFENDEAGQIKHYEVQVKKMYLPLVQIHRVD